MEKYKRPRTKGDSKIRYDSKINEPAINITVPRTKGGMDINNGNNIRRTESEEQRKNWVNSLNLNAKHFNHTTEYM
jgi:hypothetical protein